MHIALTCVEDFYGSHLKGVFYYDTYGYNGIHLNGSFRCSRASGSLWDKAEVCRAELCCALCPAAPHTWRLGSTQSGLTSADSLWGCIVESRPPCALVSRDVFVSKWPSVQTACIVCVAPEGLSRCSPPLCARFGRQGRRLHQNPIETHIGKYIHA